MDVIKQSVGKGGLNSSKDVRTVQELLNKVIKNKQVVKPLSVDGRYGKNTLKAIIGFQKNVVKMRRPDGLISPQGRTIKTLVAKTKLVGRSSMKVIKYRRNARPELSFYTKEVLKTAMAFADVDTIDISSTRRLIKDQARIMHGQLMKAKKQKISVRQVRGYGYSAPGRAVDKVFWDNVDHLSEDQVKIKMEDEIKKWLALGQRTSKHVVSESTYRALNVLDIPYSSVPMSKRDEFEQALVSMSQTVKSRLYSKNKQLVDSLGKNIIDLLIVERRCWHLEISQVIQPLPDVLSKNVQGYC
ncbi:hypothetical protein [Litoribacillus peritrichatus]|uniref:Peptidoglycan binding-like domain-containing protein n=1 Tax=Litoribacillus peritrichatus TaxID=718191 RepID=A0ABP7MKI3_9GAMM